MMQLSVPFMAHDARFKQIFGTIASMAGLTFHSSIKTGTLPLEIDAVLEISESTSFIFGSH